MSKKRFLQGTLILTCTGLATRLIGFFYRIFLSHCIGAQGMGIYQLLLPIQTLVMAVTTTGIQTAISRLSASRLALGKEKEARDYFTLGTALAFCLSIAAAWILYACAPFFAAEILKEPRTMPLLRLLAPSFPLSALHTCINGYYFSQKSTGIPSGLQLLEQLGRVGCTYLLYLICLSENRPVTPMIAVGGSLAGELAATLAALLFLGFHFRSRHYSAIGALKEKKLFPAIVRLSFPLTLNRVLLTLLHSIEVVLIPQQLRLYGMNAEEALGIYGVLTGMSLPLILFPSTITNSASVMLMPSVAELQALGRRRRIRYVAGQTSLFCLLLGGFFGLFFFFFGEPLGTRMFHSPTAGVYIRTMAFICPFLYLNSTLTSILHGLGKTGTCLVHNAVSISVRILFVTAAIPVFGIRGYLCGLLLSECMLSLLHTIALYRSSGDPAQHSNTYRKRI